MSKTGKKKKRNFINILLVILIVVAVGTLGFSAYKLIEINNGYEEASNLYADIEKQVAQPVQSEEVSNPYAGIEEVVAAPAQTVVNEVTTVNSASPELKPEETPVQKPVYPGTALNGFRTASLTWNFDALLKICEDSVGYIYQKDTMSYPIVQADDNDKYLRHLINGDYNTAGSLFVDYRCEGGLNNRYSIIYGHNMDDGSMFGSITAYADEAYYKDHPFFEVYAGKEQYQYYVYAAARVEEDSDIFTFGMNDEQFLQVMKDVRALTPYDMLPVQVTKDSHVIVLSTCIDYPRNYDFRYVVVLVRGKQLLDASYIGKLPWIPVLPAAQAADEKPADEQQTSADN